MKKVTTIAAVACLAILIMSCSKSSSDLTGNGYLKQPPENPVEIMTASHWLSPGSFVANTDRLNNFMITGTCPFSAATQIHYDKSTHAELAYARIPTGQRVPYVYKKLAFEFNLDANGLTSHILIDYELNPYGLKINFKNADYLFLTKAVDQSISENWEFRYIVIPKTKYQTLNVDWNDLPAVASALGLSL